MRVCGGCQTKLPDSWVGKCPDCAPKPPADDGIRSHGPVGAEASTSAYGHLYKSPRWIRISVMQKRSFPICEVCHVQPAEISDHRIPAVVYIELCGAIKRFLFPDGAFFDMTNLQSLCRVCHGAKTLEDSRRIATGYSWREEFEHPARAPKKYTF